MREKIRNLYESLGFVFLYLYLPIEVTQRFDISMWWAFAAWVPVFVFPQLRPARRDRGSDDDARGACGPSVPGGGQHR